MENIKDMVFAECKLQGYHPHKIQDINQLAALIVALDQENVEFGDIGITAAVYGFMAAKGLIKL